MGDINDIQNAILKAIEIMIDNKIKKLNFNYYVDAVIKNINTTDTNETYGILCNGSLYNNVPTLHGRKFEVGDVVQVLIKNGDWNKKFIDDKSNHYNVNGTYDLETTVYNLGVDVNTMKNEINTLKSDVNNLKNSTGA